MGPRRVRGQYTQGVAREWTFQHNSECGLYLPGMRHGE